MKRQKWIWLIALVAILVCVFVYLILTGERGLFGRSMEPRPIDVTRLSGTETERLGWKPSESWIERITDDFTETGNEDNLRSGHGYLWWIPGPDTGLPEGSFSARGFGRQALFVNPAWRTVIVHQSDTTEVRKRFFGLILDKGIKPEEAFEQVAFSCRKRSKRTSEFCVEHRFILRSEFAELVALIAEARVQPQ